MIFIAPTIPRMTLSRQFKVSPMSPYKISVGEVSLTKSRCGGYSVFGPEDRTRLFHSLSCPSLFFPSSPRVSKTEDRKSRKEKLKSCTQKEFLHFTVFGFFSSAWLLFWLLPAPPKGTGGRRWAGRPTPSSLRPTPWKRR